MAAWKGTRSPAAVIADHIAKLRRLCDYMGRELGLFFGHRHACPSSISAQKREKGNIAEAGRARVLGRTRFRVDSGSDDMNARARAELSEKMASITHERREDVDYQRGSPDMFHRCLTKVDGEKFSAFLVGSAIPRGLGRARRKSTRWAFADR